jgi:hypothetical protein
MVRNVHGSAVSIELAVDGSRVREKRHFRSCSFLDACIVVHAGRRLLCEPVADFECLVGKVARFPDGETVWISVPLVVGLANVTHVVDLFAGIVDVNVLSVALEIISAVLHTPEPVRYVNYVFRVQK